MSETQYPQPPHSGRPPGRPTNGLAIAALVLGILAFLTGLVPVVGLLLGIVAVVLAVLALRKTRALQGSGKGLAITGLILGAIALITSLITTVLAGALGSSSDDAAPSSTSITSDVPSETSAAPEDTAAPTESTPTETTPSETSEPAPSETTETTSAAAQFPGQTEEDQVVQAGASVTIDGLTVTTTPLEATDDVFGTSYCTTASYQNGGDDSVSYNFFDWSVLSPNGASESATITGADDLLSSGELAPGGTVSGLVCFQDSSVAPGQNVVLYEVLSLFSAERGAWLNTIG